MISHVLHRGGSRISSQGGALKKIAPSGGRREKFWGISCEKSRFYDKKSYCFQLRREARNFWGISCEKSRFYAKKSYFFQFQGGRAPGAPPPPGSSPDTEVMWNTSNFIHRYIKVESLRSTIYEYLNWQNARYVNHSAQYLVQICKSQCLVLRNMKILNISIG